MVSDNLLLDSVFTRLPIESNSLVDPSICAATDEAYHFVPIQYADLACIVVWPHLNLNT